MPAPKGNSLWKLRAKSGRDRIFKTPDELWQSCLEYFEWVELTPVIEQIVFYDTKLSKVVKDEKAHPRPMTIQGLCIYIGIDHKSWANYEALDDFFPITTRVRGVMFEQKLSGASAGLMNPSIIARELGLGDKTITQHQPSDVTDEEIEQRIERAAERINRLRESTKKD